MVPAVAVPVNVGVVTLVIPSVADLPVSLAAFNVGVPGLPGAVTSMVMLVLADDSPTLPATSVAATVIVFVPVVRALDVTV